MTTTMMSALFPYAATTRGITVRVAVNFLPEQSQVDNGHWFWAYHIRLENEGPLPVQLITRHWEITDGRGALHNVDGEGVVGDQPVLAPGASYDYVSGCPLNTPTGVMEGSFQMLAADGMAFDAIIPRFMLSAPVTTQKG